MDYIEIMLRGYTNENDRNFLGKYFIREFKKAENKHYDLEEFFTGLLKGIDTLKNEYQKELFKRKNELYFMLSGAENGTLKYGDLKSESVEERHKKTIENCKNELSSIGLGYSTINLLHFTNGRFIGHLHYSEVEFIGNGIAKAYKVLNEPQQLEAVIPDEVKNLPQHTHIFKGNSFEIWQSMFDEFKITKTSRTDIDFMFQIMKYNKLIYDTIGYTDIKDWINKVYEISFDKIKYTDPKQTSNEKRMIAYNLINPK